MDAFACKSLPLRFPSYSYNALIDSTCSGSWLFGNGFKQMTPRPQNSAEGLEYLCLQHLRCSTLSNPKWQAFRRCEETKPATGTVHIDRHTGRYAKRRTQSPELCRVPGCASRFVAAERRSKRPRPPEPRKTELGLSGVSNCKFQIYSLLRCFRLNAYA